MAKNCLKHTSRTSNNSLSPDNNNQIEYISFTKHWKEEERALLDRLVHPYCGREQWISLGSTANISQIARGENKTAIRHAFRVHWKRFSCDSTNYLTCPVIAKGRQPEENNKPCQQNPTFLHCHLSPKGNPTLILVVCFCGLASIDVASVGTIKVTQLSWISNWPFPVALSKGKRVAVCCSRSKFWV